MSMVLHDDDARVAYTDVHIRLGTVVVMVGCVGSLPT